MERELLVYLDIDRVPVLVGRLWARERTGGETSSFVYDPTWIRRRGAFALAPSLSLTPGPHHAAKGLLSAFSDSAPDAWGRKLMLRQERARARKAGTAPRSLFEIVRQHPYDFDAAIIDDTIARIDRLDPTGAD